MTRRSVPSIDPDDLREHASHERVERIWSRLESDLDAQGLFAPEQRVSREETAPSSLSRRAAPGRLAGLQAGALPRASSRRRAWLVLAAAAVFGGGWFVGHASPRGTSDPPITVGSTRDVSVDVFAAGSQARSFQLANGGSIHLEPESTVEVAEIAESGMTLRLLRGSASIDNTHAVSGAVAIVAGEARLTAPAGGVMAVRRNERDVDVIVSGGTVDLDAPGVHQQLSSGDRLHAVPISTPTAVLDPRVHHATDADGPNPPARALRVARDGHAERGAGDPPVDAASAPSWYSRYRVGDDDGALKLLEQSGDMRTVISNAQSGAELAALSDLNSRRTDLWLLAAKRAVDEFPHDPKVVGLPMSLGNYYSQHGDEELAKKYFALAGALFADDVACRGLRTADPASPETIEKARAYLAKYPSGSCRADVELLVEGLDGQKADGQPQGDEAKDAAAPDASKNGDASKGADAAKPDAGKAVDKASEPKAGDPKDAKAGDPKDAKAGDPKDAKAGDPKNRPSGDKPAPERSPDKAADKGADKAADKAAPDKKGP